MVSASQSKPSRSAYVIGAPTRMLFEPDPENYRKDVSPRGMAVPVFFAGLAVAFASTAAGQRWIAADPVALTGCFTVYVLIYGTNLYLMKRGELLLRPEWWPMRVLGCVAAASLGCVFAATAPFAATSAWVLHLIIGMAIGLAVRPTRWMLAVLLVPALCFRAAFVPDATPLSYGVLGVAVLCAYALYSRTSKLMLRERDYGKQAEAARSIAEDAESLSAEFRLAMSLHDGLSGSLLALRHRLNAARSLEEARSIARPWLLRARSFVYRPADDVRIEPALEQLARSLGVSLKLDAQISERQLTPVERADLHWIASELLANAAAHDPKSELCLRIRAGKEGVVVEASAGPEPIPKTARGRGLRNIELRALQHGGGVTFTSDEFRVEWHRGKSLEQLVIRAATELFLVVGIFCALLWFIEWRLGPFFVVLFGVLFLVAAFWDRFARVSRALARLKIAEQQRVVIEEGDLLRLSGEALEPLIRKAEEVLADSRIDQLGLLFDALAAELRDILWSLEWTGDTDDLRQDIGDLAEQAGVTVPHVPETAVRSARERWHLIAGIRRRAADQPVQSETTALSS